MKYKALFLDIDGTIVPYHQDYPKLIPTRPVTQAIQKASKKLTICLTTGRPFFMTTKILKHLDMKKGYVVINDGAQVIDLSSGKILYERVIPEKEIHTLCKVLKKMKISFFINDNEKEFLFNDTYRPKKPLNILVRFLYDEKTIDKAIDTLSDVSSITVNKTHGGGTHNFGLLISHAEATKLHGIYEVTKRLRVKRDETIGVGDSGNDFPLLMASGFKVAMGNAIDDLKAIADYVAPSVEKDGIVDVIEKFVLSKK